MRPLLVVLCLLIAPAAGAASRTSFASIDGGAIDIAVHDGPVMVVNTASLCAFTPQYDGLQDLHEAYGDRGLLVLAVPSDDFRQELDSEAEVAEFCELTFGLTLSMTEIARVTGPQAHPFYLWLAQSAGFAPRWNFNKVLLDGDGRVVATWGSATDPTSPRITDRIEALLP